MSHPQGKIELLGTDYLLLEKQAIFEGTVFVEIPKENLEDRKETIEFGMYNKKGNKITTTKILFLSSKNNW